MPVNEYGIKYEKIQIYDYAYLFIPTEVIEGYSVQNQFLGDEKLPILKPPIDLTKEQWVVDDIVSLEELSALYNDTDTDLLTSLFFEEIRDTLIYVEITADAIIKKIINVREFRNHTPTITLSSAAEEASASLNFAALKELLSIDDIKKLKQILQSYQNGLSVFQENAAKSNIASATIENGKVTYLNFKKTDQNSQSLPALGKDISLSGLENYINDRVFGHKDEIRRIASILLMNYTAEEKEEAESIFIPGPTGVGKTATFQAACEYLNIPYIEVNTPNLVPSGIVGPRLEDSLYSLYLKCNSNLSLAQKGIIICDEFDKLGNSSLNVKQSVKDIFLVFIAGGTFLIGKQEDIPFDTTMNSKIFLGTCASAFEQKNAIGFATTTKEQSPAFDIKKLYETNMYSEEVLTRITHIIPYGNLSEQTKKEILLYSKLSRYLKKKNRYQRQFGISLESDDSYVEAILSRLQSKGQSIRELNNAISESLSEAEHALLSNPTAYKRLILTHKTVEDPHNFDLI